MVALFSFTLAYVVIPYTVHKFTLRATGSPIAAWTAAIVAIPATISTLERSIRYAHNRWFPGTLP